MLQNLHVVRNVNTILTLKESNALIIIQDFPTPSVEPGQSPSIPPPPSNAIPPPSIFPSPSKQQTLTTICPDGYAPDANSNCLSSTTIANQQLASNQNL